MGHDITWVGIWNDIERGRIKFNPTANAKPVCPHCGYGLNLHSPHADDWYCSKCEKDFTANRLERIGKTWEEFDTFIADYFGGNNES